MEKVVIEETKAQKRSFYKTVWALLIPIALQNLITVGVSAADVLMLGAIGDEAAAEVALSAASLAGQVTFIFSLILFGLSSGAAVLTAQYWGKGDRVSVEKVLALTVRFAYCFGIPFFLAALCLPEPLVRVFAGDEAVIAEGVKYLRIVSASYLFMSFSVVFLNVMRSVERVIVSSVVYFVSLVVNVILNAVFIFGAGALPAMGVSGAAIATLCARVFEFCIVVVYACAAKLPVRFRIRYLFRSEKQLVKDYFRYAGPVLLNELFWGSGTSAVTAVIGHLGNAASGANAVVQVVRQLGVVFTMGVSNAAAIVIGKTIGEGREKEARVYSGRLVCMSAITGVASAAVVLCCIPVLTRLLDLSEEAKSNLIMMLCVLAVYILFQSVACVIVVGLLRAGGDTRFGLITDVGFLWLFSVPAGAIAAFALHAPLWVTYILLSSDEVLKAVPVFLRYRSGKWLKNVTRDRLGQNDCVSAVETAAKCGIIEEKQEITKGENGMVLESFDGKKICVYEWLNAENPKGIVQIVHGMTEHATRYEAFARFLNEHGFLVVADDHRGHGATDPDTLGYCKGNMFRDTVTDEGMITDHYKAKFPYLPYFVFGFSYGSFLTQSYIGRFGDKIDGAVIGGSNYKKDGEVYAGSLVTAVCNFFGGEKKPAKMIEKLSFGAYEKQFEDGEWLSNDQENNARYHADRLCGFTCSNRFYADFFKGLKSLYTKKYIKSLNKDLPLLLVAGAKDPVGDQGKGMQKLRDFYAEEAGVKDVRLVLFENSRHEFLNEKENAEEKRNTLLQFFQEFAAK